MRRRRGASRRSATASLELRSPWVLSFATVLIMWTNHHKMFRLIRRSDHAFLMINGCC